MWSRVLYRSLEARSPGFSGEGEGEEEQEKEKEQEQKNCQQKRQ